MKIGFIGLGNMGGPMARNLLKAGHALRVYDVVAESQKKFVEAGCEGATSAADACKGVELVVTMLPYVTHMSHEFYLCGAVVLGAVFLYYAVRLINPPSELFAMAQK